MGQGSSFSRLGYKGRRWAQLWRQHYGARLGIYNRKLLAERKSKAKKGAKKPGTYTAAKCGVLAAAEYVVELSKQQESQDGSHQQTPFGVSKTFLQSAVGDKKASPYNNARLTKFQNLTTAKKVRSQPFMRRNEELKKRRKDVKAAQEPIDLNSIRSIAFLGERGVKLPFPIAANDAVKEACGPDRSREASLVVIDDLGRLFDCPDESTMNQVFAIVARGLPVITLSSWRLARGKVSMIPRESVTRHVALATTTKFIFEYSPAFRSRYQLMLSTMTHCSKLPGCKWIVRQNSAVGEAARAESGFKVIKLDGIEVVRSWIQSNRRIVNTCGSKFKILT